MSKQDKNKTKPDKTGHFASLCEPLRMGERELRNRIVFPAATTGYATEGGHLTDRCISYYVERAAGGAGLIIVEPAIVSALGRHDANTPMLHDDSVIPMHERLCELVHAKGALVFIQLAHAGRKASSRLTGEPPVGPSPHEDSDVGEKPVELTPGDISKVVEEFAAAARRARHAGYDGVEIQAAGGFLIHQFLSTQSNRRRDDYGGSVESRGRLLIEIVASVRQACPGIEISVRLSPGRREDYPIPVNELVEFADLAAVAGASCINVGTGSEVLPRTDRAPVANPGEVRRPAEPLIRKRLRLPVIGSGDFLPLDQVAALIAEDRVDLVALSRPIISDPELPRKLFEDRAAEARPCIRCNVCHRRIPRPAMACPSNPRVGREQLFWMARRGEGHYIIVVGAGLAGLWTAVVAAELGYEVELIEPGRTLGNLNAIRSRIPGRVENYAIVDYLSLKLNELGVRVRMRKSVTPREIVHKDPDAVFITRMGDMIEPDIKGLSNVQVIDPLVALTSDPTMGQKIVVLGGGLMGAEIAYFLARRNRQVTLLERKQRLASDTDPELRQKLVAALREMNCPVHVGVSDVEVNIYGEITAMLQGRSLKVLVDTVIYAGDYRRCDGTFSDLEGRVKEVHFIGDAWETAELTRMIYEATGALVDMADRLRAKGSR